MARIRSIHPSLCTDEIYMSMTMPSKAAWPLLWMECDDQGVFEWKPVVLKARLFPADTINIDDVLSELESLGAIKKVEISGKPCGLVRNFCKYQRPKKPAYRYTLTDEFRTFVALKSPSSEPVPNQLPTSPEKPPQMEDEGGKRKEEKKESRAVAKATRPSNAAFDEFLKVYPRRKGANPKDPARKLFDAAVKSGIDPAAIIAGARRCAVADRDKIGTEFIPQAVKWLRDRRWEDYSEPSAASTAPVEINWAQAVGNFRKFSTWHPSLGPAPGLGGCRVPAEFLAAPATKPAVAAVPAKSAEDDLSIPGFLKRTA